MEPSVQKVVDKTFIHVSSLLEDFRTSPTPVKKLMEIMIYMAIMKQNIEIAEADANSVV